jgi:hypothetical protein
MPSLHAESNKTRVLPGGLAGRRVVASDRVGTGGRGTGNFRNGQGGADSGSAAGPDD